MVDGEAAERLIDKFDNMPADEARASILEEMRGAGFRRHVSGAAYAAWPAARLTRSVQCAMSAESPTVRLSPETAIKQADRHADVGPEDYLRVQRILDEGRVFRSAVSSRAIMGFIEEDGKMWRAVVKTTRDGRETYLTTLHRAQDYDLRSAIRNLEEIGRE